MIKEIKIFEESWLQTDGSDETLQYGRKVGESSWEYMEWVDNPWETELEIKDSEFKLNNLDSDRWRKDIINLNDYTKKEILSAIECYGYNFEHFSNVNVFNITQSGFTYSAEDSIQLACECLFEQEM